MKDARSKTAASRPAAAAAEKAGQHIKRSTVPPCHRATLFCSCAPLCGASCAPYYTLTSFRSCCTWAPAARLVVVCWPYVQNALCKLRFTKPPKHAVGSSDVSCHASRPLRELFLAGDLHPRHPPPPRCCSLIARLDQGEVTHAQTEPCWRGGLRRLHPRYAILHRQLLDGFAALPLLYSVWRSRRPHWPATVPFLLSSRPYSLRIYF